MKFTSEFIDILTHFNRINSNMYFREGNIQSTGIFTNRNELLFFVRAITNVNIDKSFAISDLIKFVAVLKMFNDPHITLDNEINNKSLIITGDNKSITYRLSDPTYINYDKKPDTKQVTSSGIETMLTKSHARDILGMMKPFNAQHITFIGLNGKFHAKVWTANNTSTDIGEIHLGNTNEIFEATISANNFKINFDEEEYKVIISRRPYVYFGNKTFEYFIPCEKDYTRL